eukprot:119473-Alexandrium_andersonii.AAC.1
MEVPSGGARSYLEVAVDPPPAPGPPIPEWARDAGLDEGDVRADADAWAARCAVAPTGRAQAVAGRQRTIPQCWPGVR